MKARELIQEFILREESKGLRSRTLSAKKDTLESFTDRVKKPLGMITRDDVQRYVARMSSAAMHNRNLYMLRQFFEYLVETERLLINPALNIEHVRIVSRGSPGVFTEDEIKRLLRSIPCDIPGIRDRAVIEILYSTGIRRAELAGLNCDDIDFRKREVCVRCGKYGKERIVPIGEAALTSLQDYCDYRLRLPGADEALFLSRYGARLSKKTISDIIFKRKKAAGIHSPGGTHALRHSCASHLLKNGAPLESIQRILGHESIATTHQYTHIHEHTLREMYTKAHPKAMKEE